MSIRHDKKTVMRPLRDMMVEVANEHGVEPHLMARKDSIATPARIDFVKRAYEEGYMTRQIANVMNRRPNTIRKLRKK